MIRATKPALVPWLKEIAAGEARDGRSSLRHFAAGEDGLLSWVTLLAVLFFLVVASLVANTGHTLGHKLETQNTADSVAYSGAVWMARGMNAVTASNHMIGELTALWVLHHAIGGDYLDEHASDREENSDGESLYDTDWNWWGNIELMWINIDLDLAWLAADIARKVMPGSPEPFEKAYDRADPDPIADRMSMLYPSKIKLKKLLTKAFQLHAFGQLIHKIPIIGPIGQAIMVACFIVELYIYKEYVVLDVVEELALTLYPAKQQLGTIMDVLYQYQLGMANGVPYLGILSIPTVAGRAGEEIGKRNKAIGEVVLSEIKDASSLPVVPETTKDENRSQLMRAFYPWVHYWRDPLIEFLQSPVWGAPLSGAPDNYMKFSNYYSPIICKRFRTATNETADHDNKGRGYRLHVLRGLDVPKVEKGNEEWTKADQSAIAEQYFCLMGFAHRQAPPHLFAKPFFTQPNPDGLVAYAQAMFYNANPQLGDPDGVPTAPPDNGLPFDLPFDLPLGGTSQNWQPLVGWDTLNWRHRVVEYVTTDENPQAPVVQLNWQAKLVPVTQKKLDDSLGRVKDSEIDAFVRNYRPVFESSEAINTH